MAENSTKEKVLEDVEALVLEEIKKVTRKGEVLPNEWDNLKKAMCIWSECCSIKDHMSGIVDSDYGYSGRTYRMPPISYGVPHHMDTGMSHERGRSSTTGRYISRGRDDGYSGHSIDDRAVASLERLYDNAQSQHEKERLDMLIQQIRSGEM